MKELFQKISEGLKPIFGYGIMISLIMGSVIFFGYVLAIIVGGDTAAMLCEVIYKIIAPVMIYLTSSMVLLGLLIMYMSGETALSVENKKKNKK